MVSTSTDATSISLQPSVCVEHSTATAAVTTLLDSRHQLGTETGDLRLVVCLLGIRQQPFTFADTLLKVDSLFEVHGYFTFRPSL